MRVLVAGAGAMGGFLAARLALAGHPVDVVARGEHLRAMRERGLTLVADGEPARTVPVGACASLQEAPPADVLLVAFKAHQLPALAEPLARAAARSALTVPVHNGVGWWYFQRAGGRFEGRAVESVDPGGRLAASMPLERTVPMFAFKSAEVVAPGVVSHVSTGSDAFACGTLDGAPVDGLARWTAALADAGLRCDVADVRTLMWTKLMGNVFANPICALTGVPLGPAVAHPDVRELALALMRECIAVARAYGVTVAVDPEQRLARGAAVGAARPSMLQDRDAGRPMELDAILGALVELARLVEVPVPRVRTLLACLRLIESEGPAPAPRPQRTPEASPWPSK